MIAMTAATFAVSCFTPLLVIFVRDILQANVRVFGAISMAIGLGMIAGTRGVRWFSRAPIAALRSPRHMMIGSLAVIAAGILVMGASASAIATALGAFLMGAGVGLLMVPAQTLIQSETPRAMVGRATSAVMSLISVAQILGLVLSGVSAAAIGLRPLFFASAAILAAVAAAGYGRLQREKNCPTPLDALNTVN
jgi:MFS family permease